jgi:hypothetical protein
MIECHEARATLHGLHDHRRPARDVLADVLRQQQRVGAVVSSRGGADDQPHGLAGIEIVTRLRGARERQ